MILLDTHVLPWWLADDKQLGIEARDLIADPANDILVSVASLWEIAGGGFRGRGCDGA